MNRRTFNRVTALTAASVLTSCRCARSEIRKIGTGQIGTSHSHAEAKLETVKRLQSFFRFCGIAEENEAYRLNAGEKTVFSGSEWLTVEELLKDPGLEAVLIETDPDDLLPAALRCVNKGMHVHVDKPPGRSLPVLSELLQTAMKRQLTVQMGYMFRYHPAFQFCVQAVRDGLIGELFEVDGVISKAVNTARRPSLIRNYGGAMMLLGCHLLDMVIAVCGKPHTVTGYRRRTMDDELYDNELAVLEYPGITATVRSSLLEVEGQHRRQLVVCGTKGSIEIRPLEPANITLSLDEDRGSYSKGRHILDLSFKGGRYDAQLSHFAEMIRGIKRNPYSMEYELTLQKTLLEVSGF